MKKILSFATLLLFFASMSWAYDFSATTTAGQTLYYTIIDAGNHYVSVVPPTGFSWTEYSQPTGSLAIPETVTNGGTTYTVKAIGDDAFFECSGITSVTIPAAVTSIGEMAFWGCGSLTGISISAAVTSIGWQAFSYCPGLATMTVDEGNALFDSRNNCNAIIATASNTLIAGTKNTSIPNTVTSIGERAFRGCSSLTGLTIPNSVTSIGECAFYGCSSLTGLTIPNSVTSIGECAFYDCSGLAGVVIPNSVTTIGDEVFFGCSSLASVTIGNAVSGIGEYAFYGCSSLTSVNIPNSVYRIGTCAFRNCSSLATIAIPESVCIIGEDAFDRIDTVYFRGDAAGSPWGADTVMASYKEGVLVYESSFKAIVIGCSDTATSVTIPNSVIYIDDDAFRGCRDLTSVNIPNSVTSFGHGAFRDCAGLTSVVIPNSVTAIGGYAFYDCTGLTGISIGSAVTSIGEFAFLGCENVTMLNYNAKSLSTIDYNVHWPEYCGFRPMSPRTLVIGDSVETLPEGVFFGQSNVDTLCYNANNLTTTAEWYDESEDYGSYGFRPLSFQTLVIGDSVVTLPKGVFFGQGDLATVTIGKSVTTIEDSAFVGCGNVDTLYYNAEELTTAVAWYSLDNATIGFQPMNVRALVIGDNVKTIPDGAFFHADSLASVAFPSSLNTIKYGAFMRCQSLTEVALPDSLTEIGARAFGYCSGLSCITIPNSVTTMGAGVFKDCSALVRADIGTGVTRIGSEAFAGCTHLDTLLYNAKQLNTGSWNYSAEYGFRSSHLHVIKIGDSVRTVPQYLFYGQDSLASLSFPNSVSSIGKYAFYGCSSLESLTFPESITTISEAAFWGCSSLTHVALPKSLTSLDSYIFCECSGLQSFVVPPTVTSISQYAFLDCTSLKTIYNLSDLDIVKGEGTYGRVAYYANRVIAPARSGSGANTIYQIPVSYSFVDEEDEEETHIPRPSLPNIANLIYKDGTSWEARKIVLTDGQDAFEAPVEFSADTAVYTREFANGNRSTLYLPFAASVPTDLEVYDFSDFADNTLYFSEHTGNIAAYTPYLVGYDISAKDASTTPCTISAANVTFPKSEAGSYHPVTKGDMTFRGVIERTTMGSTSNYGYSNGFFVQSGGSAHVNPFRCYFTCSNPPAGVPPMLNVDIVDGEVGIEMAEDIDTPRANFYSNDVYDMMGRIVRRNAQSLDGLPKGVYIWKGQKVLSY